MVPKLLSNEFDKFYRLYPNTMHFRMRTCIDLAHILPCVDEFLITLSDYLNASHSYDKLLCLL